MSSTKNAQLDSYDPKTDLNYQNAQKVLSILEQAGQEARMAGGCVRDRLLGIRPKDYDVATSASPDIISTIFKQNGIKTVPTGIDHGTITVVLGGKGLEVTSLRQDVSTDGRRAVVAFGSSFEEDSLRRDFTINAMYEDRKGNIYDFHNGQGDLKGGILRFVGEPRTRIQEDYLRILRLFRFWARFGFRPAAETLTLVAEEVRGLEQISQERKTSELLLMLECSDVWEALNAMAATGCLKQVLNLDRYSERPKIFWDALYLHSKTRTQLARLAALMLNYDNKEQQWKALEGLRLSRQQVDAINVLLDGRGPSPANDPAIVYDWLDRVESHVWEDAWNDLILPVWKVIAFSPHLAILDKTIQENQAKRVCPVNGQFLIQNLKVKPGPELGAVLNEIKMGYRRGQWTTKAQALAYAKKRLQVQ